MAGQVSVGATSIVKDAILRTLLLGVMLLAWSGCVTYEEERVTPPHQTTLTVARSGDSVSIQFPTEKGVSYTVLYTTNLTSGQWIPLPNGQNLMGTGELIALEDRVPDGTQRYYRLQVHTAQAKSARRR